MKKILYLLFVVLGTSGTASAQYGRVGIGTIFPDSSSALDIVSPSKGVLIPRLTSVKRDLIIAPVNNTLIYNTDQQCYNYYDAIALLWKGIGCPSSDGTGIADVDCSSAVLTGSFYVGQQASNVVTVNVNVTQTGTWGYTSTVNGITISCSDSFAALGAQTITLRADGIPATTGTFLSTISINRGNPCQLGFTVGYGTSSGTPTCGTATVNGSYGAGTGLNGTNTITLPVAVTSPGTYTIGSNTMNGYSFGPATGTFAATGPQTITLNGTGTPVAAGTDNFTITYGASTCGKSIAVVTTPAAITTLNCAGRVVTGTLTQGSPAGSVSVSVPYTGGNGGNYAAISISSTTVTGLTATAAAGNVANGNGNLVLTISGTPAGNGTASFALSLGGQSCSFTVPVASPTPPAPTLSFCTGTGELNHAQRVGTYTIGGNSVTVTSTTTGSISTNSYTTCGLTTKSGGTEMANNSTLTLNFSRPVSNIQIRVEDLDINETLTVTTSNGNPTITKFGGTCPGNFIVTGNTMTGNIGGAGYTNGASSNLNFGGIYFTTLTLSYAGGTGLIGVSYCYGNATSL